MTRQLSAASLNIQARSNALANSPPQFSMPNVPQSLGILRNAPNAPPPFDRQPSLPNVPVLSSPMANSPQLSMANVPQTLGALGNVFSPNVQPPFSTMVNAPQPPQFGAPLRPYGLLVSGILASGTLTHSVAPSLFVMMNAQIAVWNGQTGKGSWTAKSSASNAQCVDTRRVPVGKDRNPTAGDENGIVACWRCIRKKRLCVLIGDRGPVIVPLPVNERGANASPTSGELLCKELDGKSGSSLLEMYKR